MGDEMVLIGIAIYWGHAVRSFLSLKSMVTKFKRRNNRKTFSSRINPLWRSCYSL